MDYSTRNPRNVDSLNYAARVNNYKSVKELLKKKNPNYVDNRGWTCLHEAAYNDSYESLDLILKSDECRPMCETHEGHTALYLACQNTASLKTIELLLHRVHDIANFGSTEGITPLHLASSQGRVDLIQLLLDYGATVNVQDFDEDTPLHDAVLSVKHEAIVLLLHAGADISIPNEGGYTPFHLAMSKGSISIANSMLPFVTEINQCTKGQHTPLMLSVIGANIEVIDLLLKNGANPYLKDAKGNMALDIALIHGREDIFRKMFTITRLSKMNKTLIFNACKPHYFKMPILQLLLNSDLGPEYFTFNDAFTEEFSYLHYPKYTKNAPLNIYLNISEYIYDYSPELFYDFFLLFLMRGVEVNAIRSEECPPLVYLHCCRHQNSFKSVLKVLLEFGCNVDYCSSPKPLDSIEFVEKCIPDAFEAAISMDPLTIPVMLNYSLYCDPGYLLLHSNFKHVAQRYPVKVRSFLVEATDNIVFIAGEGAKCIPFFIPSLKRMCRYRIRQTIIKGSKLKIKSSIEFLNIINGLPLPVPICNFLRFSN